MFAPHPGRQLHPLRQQGHRRLGGRRRGALAGPQRQPHGLGALRHLARVAAGLAGNWLDSNDNRGIKWRIENLGGFNTLAFFVIDAADAGGSFSLQVGKRLFSDLNGGRRLANGNIHLVHILLPRTRTGLTVRLMHDRSDDGFGIDGALVAQVAPPAPVLLPPAAALLVRGLALLAGLRRPKRRA
jgi:hypothetical protein